MKIESPQENKIVVELTDSDMSELDITYERMDYSNIETRRVVWTLLDRARRELGRDIDPSGKMLIEAMPKVDGGCVMLFTVLEGSMKSLAAKNRFLICKQENTVTYEFDCLDSLLDCAAALCGGGEVPRCDLYGCGSCYRLCVNADGFAHGAKDFFSEYGTPCASGALSLEYMREHWQLLINGNALERLGNKQTKL